MFCLVTKSEAAEARKIAAPTRSRGSPSRRNGVCQNIKNKKGFAEKAPAVLSTGSMAGSIASSGSGVGHDSPDYAFLEPGILTFQDARPF